MLTYKYFFPVVLLIILSSCSNFKNIEVFFEDGFLYAAQKDLISELKLVTTRKEIKTTLSKQEWIEDFKIKFRINGNIKVIIKTKIPIFIWNEKYYVDTNMKTFGFDKSNHRLINVFCPSNQLNQARDLIDFINTSLISDQISFKKLDFKYSSGWILLSNTTEIKFGKNITKARLNSFRQSLNYVYESKSIPSMIDLRYKDGVAFDYGK
tara:strand:- start:690 stop:1316 length:627 start_codon:yes stop_codon:yes gene_type:complete